MKSKKQIETGNLVMLHEKFTGKPVKVYTDNGDATLETRVPFLYLGPEESNNGLFGQKIVFHKFLHNGTIVRWYGKNINDYFKLVFWTKRYAKVG